MTDTFSLRQGSSSAQGDRNQPCPGPEVEVLPERKTPDLELDKV